MEYSIGFFGGSGFAYGVFSSKWPVDETKPKVWVNRCALFFVLVCIPLIIYRETLSYSYFLKRLGDIPNLESVAFASTLFVAIVLVLMAIGLFWKLKNTDYSKKDVMLFFFVYLATYILISYVVTGLFAGAMSVNHHLYVVNMILIFVLLRNGKYDVFGEVSENINTKKLFLYFIAILVCIVLFSLIAVNIHGELSGSHNRFPMD